MWDVVGLPQGLGAGSGWVWGSPWLPESRPGAFSAPSVSYIVSWGGGLCWEVSPLGPSLWGESRWAGLPAGVWWALKGEREGALAWVHEPSQAWDR